MADIEIDYTNHKGVRDKRMVRTERIWFGETEWHKPKQWLLTGYTYDRGARRDFAVNKIHAADGEKIKGVKDLQSVILWKENHPKLNER